MKLNFTNDDFEKYIRQQADQLRMRPSEKVWEKISGQVQHKRRWLGPGILLLLLTSAGFTTYLLMHHIDEPVALATIGKKTSGTNVESTGKNPENISVIKPITQLSNPKKASGSAHNGSSSLRNIEKEGFHQQDATPVQPSGSAVTNLDNTILSTVSTFTGTYADSEPFGNILRTEKEESKTYTEPYSIESVVNKYFGKRKKLSWQYYFTPTISYRKLSENKSYLRKLQQTNQSAAANYAGLYNINDVVTHKPDIGLELGIAAKYAISRKVKIRAGLQFNMTHYDIKAFENYAPQVATIALNTGYGIDSINTITKYRNMNGGTTDWLSNFYFQLSAPVGAEIMLAGNKNVQFGIASTIQPTYILGERAYLISSDYQNYTKVPWLIRRWNVNTSLETFVSYSTGQLRWQVGPQVRYQLLSSFVNEYPVKENLFDFGLKIGVGLNK